MKRVISHLAHPLFAMLLAIPFVAFAAPNAQPVKDVFTSILTVLNLVIKILISLAFVVFGWGIIKLIFAGGDSKGVADAKRILLYGVIGIFVLASLGGILFFIKTYIGVPDNSPVQIPKFQ